MASADKGLEEIPEGELRARSPGASRSGMRFEEWR